MKTIIVRVSIVLIWLALCAFESPNPFIPQHAFVFERKGYSIAYDGRTRNAFWVYEKLTRQTLEGEGENRHNIHFKSDSALPDAIRTTLDDFVGSGFDLGHLCPYVDLRSDSKAAHETFLLSNISPQLPHLNRGHWMQLEKLIRNLTLQYQTVHVITMPLFLPKDRIVSYRTIGKNQIAVPTHFCKVVFAEKEEGIDVLAFILPNEMIPSDKPLDQFQTSLENVERLAGVIFPYNHVSGAAGNSVDKTNNK